MGRLFDSKQFRTDLQLSGSFSGSFQGDGSGLTNIPAAGIVGLNLSQISSGSSTATISPNNGLQVNTSISGSIISGSTLVVAPTGSFKHIITDGETIEFRNNSTGAQIGRLKFDPTTGFNIQDNTGARTKIRAGRGEFLSLEAGQVGFNSIGPITGSIISASSTIFANDIEAFRMNVTHLTSSFITASTIETSGSNIFGDEASDTHTFIGNIIARNNISSSGYISASNFVGDGSQLSGIDSIYTANGNILETRTINDRDGGFTGSAGSNALKMNVRNSGALLVAGYQNNGDPGTTNHLIQWGPGATNGGMNVRGKLGLTSGGGRIDLTNSGGSQYFTVAQSGITSTVPLSATNITGSNISASGIFTGDGSGLINIPASGITGLNLSQIASGSATASISPDKGFQVNTDTGITGSLIVSGSGITIDSGSLNLDDNDSTQLNIPANPGVYEASYHGLTAGGSGNVVSFSANNVGQMAAIETSGRLGLLRLNNWTSGNNGVLLHGYYSTSPLNSIYYRNFIGGSLVVNRPHGSTVATNTIALDVAGPVLITGSNANGHVGLHVSSSAGSGSMKLEGDAQITGSLSVSGSVSINDSLSNIIISTIGSGSSNATTVTGDHNIVIGMNAAEDLGASSDNVIIGNRAASGSVFSSTRENNVIIGTEAGADADMVDGANVVYIGYRAGYETTGYGAIHIGANAGQYADGNGNVSVGQNSMMGHASYGGTPLYNVVIGYNAGQQFWDGDNNVAIGSYAMANTAQHYNTSTGTVAIGSGAIRNNRKNNYTTAIGFNALYALKGNDTAAGNQITTVGAYAGYTEEYGYNHTLIGYRAGYDLTASTGSIVIGHDAGSGISYMDRQLFIGSGSTALISGSLSGGLKLLGQVSASSYIGDGSSLTGVQAFPFSGSAVITGSLTVSGSVVDFTSASAVNLNIESIPLVNPIVEYVNCGAITASGATVPLPNSLTFVSSSVYEYIEIFINGLRMRYDVDFMPASTSTIKYFVTIPSGSEITYKSLKRP